MHNSDALERLFLAAPFVDFFPNADMIEVHEYLTELYSAFLSTPPPADDPDHKELLLRDDLCEVNWVIKRYGLPDWNVCWSFLRRARLCPMPQHPDAFPPVLFESTEIKPGAIVCSVVDCDGDPETYTSDWIKSR